MKDLEYFENVIDQLKNIKGDNAKIAFLSQYINDDIVKQLFYYAYNSFYVYGVTSKNLKKNSDIFEFEFFDNTIQLLDMLRTRQITGHKAIGLTNHFIDILDKPSTKQLFYDLLDRNLKIGMNVKNINKALGNYIPTFSVALANTYTDSKHQKLLQSVEYVIMRKLNGLRLVTIITYNNGNPEIKNLSRSGKEYTTCKKINNELLSIYKQSAYFGKDVVFDGEACVIDPRGKEDWNRAISEYRTKNHTVVNPRYYIFDFLSLEEFSGLSVSKNYIDRIHEMKTVFFNNNLDQCKFCFDVPFIKYSEYNVEKLQQQFLETEMWEGLMFRAILPYKSERSNDLLKYKLWLDMEFRVLDIERSTKPMLVEKNTGVYKWKFDESGEVDNGQYDWQEQYVSCVGSLIVDYQGVQLNIGSGLSDKQRILWFDNPNEIIGKQIQVKYKELTKNKQGTVSLSFATLKHVFDQDRDF